MWYEANCYTVQKFMRALVLLYVFEISNFGRLVLQVRKMWAKGFVQRTLLMDFLKQATTNKK